MAAALPRQSGAKGLAGCRAEITTSLVWDTRDNPFSRTRDNASSFTPYVAGGFLGGDVANLRIGYRGVTVFSTSPTIRSCSSTGGSRRRTEAGEVDRDSMCQSTTGFSSAARMISAALTSVMSARRTSMANRSAAKSSRAQRWNYLPRHEEKMRVAFFYDTGFVQRRSL